MCCASLTHLKSKGPGFESHHGVRSAADYHTLSEFFFISLPQPSKKRLGKSVVKSAAERTPWWDSNPGPLDLR